MQLDSFKIVFTESGRAVIFHHSPATAHISSYNVEHCVAEKLCKEKGGSCLVRLQIMADFLAAFNNTGEFQHD